MSWCTFRALLNFDMPGFRKVEKDILGHIAKNLPQDRSQAFEKWMSSVNFIQRVSSGREINFYCLINGSPHRDEEWRLSDGSGEILARLRLETQQSPAPIAVTFSGVNGIPLSLEADFPLSKIINFKIAHVDIER